MAVETARVRPDIREDTERHEVFAQQRHLQADVDNARADFAEKHWKHSEELGRLHGLQGHVDAVTTRHDSLSQLVAWRHVESMKKTGDVAAALDRTQRGQNLLEKLLVEQSEKASQRGDELALALEEAQRKFSVELGQAMHDVNRRLEALGQQVDVTGRRMDKADSRADELERASGALKQRAEQLHLERVLAGEAIEELLRINQGALLAKFQVQEAKHSEHVQSTNGACRKLSAQHQRHAGELSEAAQRTDQVSAALEKAQQGMRSDINRGVGDMHRRLGGLATQLEAHNNRVDGLQEGLQTSLQRLPEVERKFAALLSRLDDVLASASAQQQDHISSSKVQLDQYLKEHAQRNEAALGQALAAVRRRAEMHEQDAGAKLAAAAERMERTMVQETKCARQLLRVVLVETHEDLSKLREVWVPFASNAIDGRLGAGGLPDAAFRTERKNEQAAAEARKGQRRPTSRRDVS